MHTGFKFFALFVCLSFLSSCVRNGNDYLNWLFLIVIFLWGRLCLFFGPSSLPFNYRLNIFFFDKRSQNWNGGSWKNSISNYSMLLPIRFEYQFSASCQTFHLSKNNFQINLFLPPITLLLLCNSKYRDVFKENSLMVSLRIRISVWL